MYCSGCGVTRASIARFIAS
ncbi:hypothetical protein FPW49_06350, partial [Vibrio cholerae]